MHHQNHPLTYLPAQPQAEAIHLMNSNQAGKIILRTNEEIHSGDLSKIIRVNADGGFLVMIDGSRVPVASRKKDMLMELFDKLD